MRPYESTPARLSPLPVAAQPSELPYGLSWDDLRSCLPGLVTPMDARISHEKQGISMTANSCILTLRYRDAHADRALTFFVKHVTDPARAEAAKHRFLASHGVPTPRLLHTVERHESEVLAFEFLPIIGIEPGAADELLELTARLNAVDNPPNDLFQPNPSAPQAQFDAAIRAALNWLAADSATTVEPLRWFRRYQEVAEFAARLPTALNHGELSFQQLGRSTVDSQLLVFDLETTALLPRFSDIASILGSLVAYTGRTEHDLFGVYLQALRRFTGTEHDDSRARQELRLVRAVRQFWSLPWLLDMAGDPRLRDSAATAASTIQQDLGALGLLD